MVSYGIGITRLPGTIVETLSRYGVVLLWPESVAISFTGSFIIFWVKIVKDAAENY